MTGLILAPVMLVRLLLICLGTALSQVWANKTRSVLTTTGIVVGVASVTAVIAALTGLRANVLKEFEAIGTNKIFVIPHRPEEGRFRRASWSVLRFKPNQFDAMLDHCPSVERFTRVCQANTQVTFADRTLDDVATLGIDAAWHQIEDRAMQIGRPFTFIDDDQARNVCLINPEARDKLRLDRDCTGQSIFIDGRRFLIVGVVEPQVQSAMFGGRDAGAEVIVPFRTAWELWRPWIYVIAASRSPEVSEEAQAELRHFLRQARDLRPDDPDTFRFEVIEKYIDQFKTVATVVTTIAACIVGISLLVGGIGIMNIMLVSVSERTREIGLRKAVGARSSVILVQFLIEAMTLCALGGAIGVAGGQLLTWLMAVLPGAGLEQAYIPLWAVAMSFAFAAGVGVIFGMFPAIKAARLDPIEALRHE